MARREQRPPRRYYELTGGGKTIALDASDARRRWPRPASACCGRSKARASMRNSPSLTRAIGLVRVASRLVPRRLRDDWRAEWEAELAAADPQSPRFGRQAKGGPRAACDGLIR